MGSGGGPVVLGTSLKAKKVAVSIPDNVVGVFHKINPFRWPVATWSNLLLTKFSYKNIS